MNKHLILVATIILLAFAWTGCATDQADVYGEQTTPAPGDVNPVTIIGTLSSPDELEGNYGQNYTIVETQQDLTEFVGKQVQVEAVVLEEGGQPDIKINSIEELQ